MTREDLNSLLDNLNAFRETIAEIAGGGHHEEEIDDQLEQALNDRVLDTKQVDGIWSRYNKIMELADELRDVIENAAESVDFEIHEFHDDEDDSEDDEANQRAFEAEEDHKSNHGNPVNEEEWDTLDAADIFPELNDAA